MMAFLIHAQFAATGIFAVLALVATWRRHGPAVLALRGELAACGDDLREMCFRLSGYDAPRPSARVYRPSFRPAARAGLVRPSGWRDAA